MSSFANSTTRIIDPVYDRKNQRLEFRLHPDTLYLSNMRLLNIGITSDNGADNYNKALGAYGAIRSISLLDGSQLLDQLQSVPVVQTFKNLNRRNDTQLSTGRELYWSNYGFTSQGKYTVNANAIQRSSIKVNIQNPNNALAGKEAWISLRDCLSFLENSMSVPTNVYRQLRLVVEYNDPSVLKFLCNNENATHNTTENALLVVDEVNDGDLKERMMKEYKGVVYKPLEVDSVVVEGGNSAGGGGATDPFNSLANTPTGSRLKQSKSYLLNGFNDKKLHRLAIAQTPTSSATWVDTNVNTGLASVASVAQFHNELQVRVNGSNKLAGQGQSQSVTGDGSNRKLRFLNDTWGVSNVVQGFNSTGTNKQADYLATDVVPLVGEQQFLGLRIGEYIRELQIFYNRDGVFNNPKSTQQLTLNVIGEVEKAVIVNSDNSYNVVYAQ